MRVQRRERAIRALRLGSLIAVRTKRWLSQTRKRIEGARAERRRAEAEEEIKRQQAEAEAERKKLQAKQEQEIKKQKEEAERKLLESGLSAAQAARVEMLQLAKGAAVAAEDYLEAARCKKEIDILLGKTASASSSSTVAPFLSESQVAELQAENSRLRAENNELKRKLNEKTRGGHNPTWKLLADLKKEVGCQTPEKGRRDSILDDDESSCERLPCIQAPLFDSRRSADDGYVHLARPSKPPRPAEESLPRSAVLARNVQENVATVVDAALSDSASLIDQASSLFDPISRPLAEHTRQTTETLSTVMDTALSDSASLIDQASSLFDQTSKKVVEDTRQTTETLLSLPTAVDAALSDSAKTIESKRNDLIGRFDELRNMDSAEIHNWAQAQAGSVHEQAQAFGASLLQWGQATPGEVTPQKANTGHLTSNGYSPLGEDLGEKALEFGGKAQELGEKAQEQVQALGDMISETAWGWWSDSRAEPSSKIDRFIGRFEQKSAKRRQSACNAEK